MNGVCVCVCVCVCVFFSCFQNHGLKADMAEAQMYIERYETNYERQQGRIQVLLTY